MQNMFNITKSSKFLSLHIIIHISIIKFRKKFIAITTIWFGLTALFKVVEIFNFGVKIRINLILYLIF